MRPSDSRGAIPPRSGRLAASVALAVGLLLLAGCGTGSSSPTPSATPDSPVTVAHDLVFASPSGVPLELDACTPPSAAHPLPVVVIVHSGGFTQGSHSDLDWLCEQGARHGFAAFTIDYRLLPAHFPSQLQDVVSAVDWISADARVKRFHVDPGRVVLLGTSAGATVVSELLTGVPGSPVGPSRFRGGALLSAAFDFSAVAAKGSGSSQAGVEVTLQYSGCTTTDCPALSTISAAHAVDRSDPPMFLANSTDELVPLAQATEMAAVLQKAGVRHELRIAQGEDHAEFIAKNHPEIDDEMWAFLRTLTP